MTIKQKLFAALDKIGKTNGHGVPTSQDPSVPLIHEYHVTTLAESYFKKRRENAKKSLEKALTAPQKKLLEDGVVSVKKNEVADSVTLGETDPYILSVDVKTGASFLDVQQLKVALMREHKMDATKVEALIESCTDRRDPSQSWKVTERRYAER